MHTNLWYSALAISLTVLSPACASYQPIRNVGIVKAPEGVEVSVLRESCSQNVDPEWPGADLVEATIETQVRNMTSDPILVHRDGFRLTAPDGQEIPTSTWSAQEPMSIAAGQTATFALRFSDRGGLSCSKEMRLDAPAAVTKGADVVRVASVAFLPTQF
jgi:hypothetical protein